jgi:hypothetical protein
VIGPPLQAFPRRDLVQACCLLRGNDPAELASSWRRLAADDVAGYIRYLTEHAA